MLSLNKLDNTFTSAQFSINGIFVPHRLDRNDKGWQDFALYETNTKTKTNCYKNFMILSGKVKFVSC